MQNLFEQNLARVRQRIAAACGRAGRRPEEVRLVAVTKTFSADVVRSALRAGVQDIGENRVQELREKAEQISEPVRWHLIGHLQSNKARIAARLCEVIQTVDSVELAERISHEAVASGKEIEILIQVNVGGEEQKSGVQPSKAHTLAGSIRRLDGLRLTGLMTIPPIADENQTRAYFRRLRQLRDELGLAELSMGMTDDFEMAIEEGSTLIRVGRAIFGERV